jgi:serine/threonine protein kinase
VGFSKTGKKRFVEVDLSQHSVDFYHADELICLPHYNLADFGLSGRVAGLGTYGNVLEGVLGGLLPVALKLFDLRRPRAREAFVAEQKAYKDLKPLWGKCVAILYGVGYLAHYNTIFMAFSDEGVCKLGTSPLTRRVKKQVLEALDDIHSRGILHNDVKFEHILISQGTPKFIDFQGSSTSASSTDLNGEQNYMQVLLEDENEGLRRMYPCLSQNTTKVLN